MRFNPLLKRNTKRFQIINLTFQLIVFVHFYSNSYGQNLLSVPFTSGFVGDVNGNNSATGCVLMSSLGWNSIYFSQTTNSTVFVSQGNDIIGNVVITDAVGNIHTVPGYIKWRAPSGSPTCLVFSPTSTVSLATSGGGVYTISSTKYIGLIFNGQTLSLSGGNVSGNASTTGLLDVLNSYLSVFPAISITDITVNESIGTISLSISLSQSTSSEVRVNYATSNGTASSGLDYTSKSGQIVFSAYQTSLSVTVNVLTDLLSEPTEIFYVNLSGSVNASILKSVSTINITDNPPLPVDLLSFLAVCSENVVDIKWETGSEFNSDYFIIDRKIGDEDWFKLSKIPASNYSTEKQTYSIKDQFFPTENVYYRLSQFDKDGKSKTFEPTVVNCFDTELEVEIFPIPAVKTLNVRLYNTSSEFITITLLNSLGESVTRNELNELGSEDLILFDIGSLNNGIYILKIENDHYQISKKIVIQN